MRWWRHCRAWAAPGKPPVGLPAQTLLPPLRASADDKSPLSRPDSGLCTESDTQRGVSPSALRTDDQEGLSIRPAPCSTVMSHRAAA